MRLCVIIFGARWFLISQAKHADLVGGFIPWWCSWVLSIQMWFFWKSMVTGVSTQAGHWWKSGVLEQCPPSGFSEMVNLYTLRLELNWMSSRPTLHITIIKPSRHNKCDNINLLIFFACSSALKHLQKKLHNKLASLIGSCVCYPGWANGEKTQKESGLGCTHLQLAQMILLLYGIAICALWTLTRN
jgi:hypothetical protein